MKNIFFLILLFAVACKQEPKTTIAPWVPYDETEELAENAEHASKRLRYKFIQSRISDKNELWKNVADQIRDFAAADYERLTPLILEQDIPSIQNHIKAGRLSYESLTQWYLFRIVRYENNPDGYLNNIIAINPNAVAEARNRDRYQSKDDHPLYGMPILLKDNINFGGLPTTAGTHLLRNNDAADAFVVKRIKEKGGIILGKSNLSEWANYLCLECPNGYSAVGGQTLNPYGRKKFDTGGSSSGSGSAIAANYAAVAVGTETSGSILSPSSSNSIVGLKPTTGLLSRSGIVPLSSTLDTPGPMTKNVIDAAIFISAMTGADSTDVATKDSPRNNNTYWETLKSGSLEGVRFGVNTSFLKDTVYKDNVEKIVALGGIAVAFEPMEMDFDGFGSLLSADMQIDLPKYLNEYASKTVSARSIADVVAYNTQDSVIKIPYGQGRFENILETFISPKRLEELCIKFRTDGVQFFEETIAEHQLDVILSINNWNAHHAAAANYPCLTVPMGYRNSGEPVGITFIGRPYTEAKLLKMAYAFEKATKARKLPQEYK